MARADKTELDQIDSYETFMYLGIKVRPPPHIKQIRVHMVYDVTQVFCDNSQVGCRWNSNRFLAKLNQFETWKTHFGNAYLEVYVQEKLYIFEGPEFGFQDGRIYITHKQFTA